MKVRTPGSRATHCPSDVTDDPVVREPFLHEGDLTLKVIALADRGDSAVAEALHAGMGCFRRLRTSSVACDVAADIVKPLAARAASARLGEFRG